MKLQQHHATIIPAFIIVLCAMSGGYIGQQNHEEMVFSHEEKIQLVKNDKKDVVEKRNGERVS